MSSIRHINEILKERGAKAAAQYANVAGFSWVAKKMEDGTWDPDHKPGLPAQSHGKATCHKDKAVKNSARKAFLAERTKKRNESLVRSTKKKADKRAKSQALRAKMRGSTGSKQQITLDSNKKKKSKRK